MTAIYTNNEELKNIYDSFYLHVNHPYLNKYIKNPEIDEDQAEILLLMLKEKDLSDTFIHDCILTTMLVQAALDIHETVDTHELGTSKLKTKRQLSVLGGDYYSSLYYYVLSKLENSSLIRAFARSIQEINESKMNIYKQHKKNAQPSLNDLKKIYSSVHINIAELLDLNDWSEGLEQFFLLKSLLKERFDLIESGKTGIIAQSLHQIMGNSLVKSETKPDTINYLNSYIELTDSNLKHFNWRNEEIQKIFQKRTTNLLLKYQLSEQCVVEEG
ncbi:heptaprenyl diphosphate synthase component 1 [Salipaludibacillus sp. CF4.18]|uniref:heptaprenyl diphosphate synthase component 1 n=1 Tax=Salipaludibacillus sp. CF4.18 TaxID=3373081 RepID=UPI003EE62451